MDTVPAIDSIAEHPIHYYSLNSAAGLTVPIHDFIANSIYDK